MCLRQLKWAATSCVHYNRQSMGKKQAANTSDNHIDSTANKSHSEAANLTHKRHPHLQSLHLPPAEDVLKSHVFSPGWAVSIHHWGRELSG